MMTQVSQMRNRSGPYFQAWRRQTAASVGATVLDDLQNDE
jgi:hypothetical protein